MRWLVGDALVELDFDTNFYLFRMSPDGIKSIQIPQLWPLFFLIRI